MHVAPSQCSCLFFKSNLQESEDGGNHSAVAAPASEADSAAGKVRFCREAISGPDPFMNGDKLEEELVEIVKWLAAKSPAEVNRYREVGLT